MIFTEYLIKTISNYKCKKEVLNEIYKDLDTLYVINFGYSNGKDTPLEIPKTINEIKDAYFRDYNFSQIYKMIKKDHRFYIEGSEAHLKDRLVHSKNIKNKLNNRRN